MAVILIAIGLLFTGLDFFVGTPVLYPEYVKPVGQYLGVDLAGTIQHYVNDYAIGNVFRLDIFSDIIGFVLIFIGIVMLLKHDKKYFSSIVLCVLSLATSLAFTILPFFVNSAARVVWGMILFFAALFVKIWMEYKVIYLTAGISDNMINFGTNRRVQFCFWGSVFTRVFAAFLLFVGHTSVKYVYQGISTLLVILMAYFFAQTRKYVGTYKVYKEGFNSSIIPDHIKEKIMGVSFKENNVISMDELRYTRVLYMSFDGQVKEGELIVNQKIAYPTMKVFYKLFKLGYPIEKINLIDEYEGDDFKSMADNNTSAFNFRKITGFDTDKYSNHAFGMAIDINPRINPYVIDDTFYPENGEEYLERDMKKCKGKYKDYMIQKGDLCYNIFKKNGFSWGGDWNHAKDYQHFEVVE